MSQTLVGVNIPNLEFLNFFEVLILEIGGKLHAPSIVRLVPCARSSPEMSISMILYIFQTHYPITTLERLKDVRNLSDYVQVTVHLVKLVVSSFGEPVEKISVGSKSTIAVNRHIECTHPVTLLVVTQHGGTAPDSHPEDSGDRVPGHTDGTGSNRVVGDNIEVIFRVPAPVSLVSVCAAPQVFTVPCQPQRTHVRQVELPQNISQIVSAWTCPAVVLILNQQVVYTESHLIFTAVAECQLNFSFSVFLY